MALLEIESLRVAYPSSQGEAVAVDGVSFHINQGESLGLVGESGCGKSTIAKAILGILPEGARAQGSVRYDGRELLGLSPAELRRIRWRDIALIPQNAMNGFDPVYTIEKQLDEAIAAHELMPPEDRKKRIAGLFAAVGLSADRLKAYAHQFSGGMRQRAMIAMALVLNPKLILADEPTTGLDVIVQDQILERMGEIHVQSKNAMLLISHDMALVSENCDRIAVMYAGRIVEEGDAYELLSSPSHPYTLGLVNAFPAANNTERDLISIAGSPPSLIDPPAGCRFHPRCPFATARCATDSPPLTEVTPNHLAACHYINQAERFRALTRDPATWRTTATI